MATYKDIVISNLHEMKSRYQRNLLIGTGTVLGLSMVVALVLLIGDPPRERRISAVMFDRPHVTALGGRGGAGATGSGGRFGGHTYDGFGGFDGYRIVRESGPVLTYEPENQSFEVSPESFAAGPPGPPDARGIAGGGRGSGIGIGDGLPCGLSLIQIANRRFPRNACFRSTIDPPRPDEPAFIKLTKVPRVSSDYFGKGCVSVEFTIMKNGNIIDRTVVDEDPIGFGAADSLFAALGEARCWAAKNHGKKVDTRITFTWQYCRGDGCGKDDVVTFGDQRVLVYDGSPQPGPIAGR